MLSSLSSRLSLAFCILLAMSHLTASMSIRQQRNDVSNVADALKYLQELDSIYSQISRPRFGKRSGFPRYLKDANPEEPEVDSIKSLY